MHGILSTVHGEVCSIVDSAGWGCVISRISSWRWDISIYRILGRLVYHYIPGRQQSCGWFWGLGWVWGERRWFRSIFNTAICCCNPHSHPALTHPSLPNLFFSLCTLESRPRAPSPLPQLELNPSPPRSSILLTHPESTVTPHEPNPNSFMWPCNCQVSLSLIK
jgi:hypothetical protein